MVPKNTTNNKKCEPQEAERETDTSHAGYMQAFSIAAQKSQAYSCLKANSVHQVEMSSKTFKSIITKSVLKLKFWMLLHKNNTEYIWRSYLVR